MALKTYIGARYTPKYMGEWNKQTEYGPLSVVSVNEDANYVSKKVVPAGTEISNAEFWLKVASWNAQVEQYTQNVNNYRHSVEEYKLAVEAFYADTIHAYDNKAAMIADTSLKDGETVITCGGDTIGDGMGSFYQIVTYSDSSTIQLVNGLYAKPFTFELYTKDNNFAALYPTYTYYLNSTTGNDNNDGKSESTPFQTFDRIVKEINNGKTQLYINITDSATYTCHYNSFMGIAMHLTHSVSGANPTIEFDVNNARVAFYHSHLNITGINFNHANNRDIYLEACSTSLTNVQWDLKSELLLYGGFCVGNNITCKTLRADRCLIVFQNLTITNTADTNNALITCNTCPPCRIYGSLTFSEPTNASTTTKLFNFNMTHVQWTPNITNRAMTNKWGEALCTYSLINLPSEYEAKLTDVCSGFNSRNTVKITTNATLPSA